MFTEPFKVRMSGIAAITKPNAELRCVAVVAPHVLLKDVLSIKLGLADAALVDAMSQLQMNRSVFNVLKGVPAESADNLLKFLKVRSGQVHLLGDFETIRLDLFDAL